MSPVLRRQACTARHRRFWCLVTRARWQSDGESVRPHAQAPKLRAPTNPTVGSAGFGRPPPSQIHLAQQPASLGAIVKSQLFHTGLVVEVIMAQQDLNHGGPGTFGGTSGFKVPKGKSITSLLCSPPEPQALHVLQPWPCEQSWWTPMLGGSHRNTGGMPVK